METDERILWSFSFEWEVDNKGESVKLMASLFRNLQYICLFLKFYYCYYIKLFYLVLFLFYYNTFFFVFCFSLEDLEIWNGEGGNEEFFNLYIYPICDLYVFNKKVQ